ncbi:MAG TPA: hypothetical protein VNR65_01795 [Geobacterales bacterium]|nr:hypothetical protein [Geobacterales bacterium]
MLEWAKGGGGVRFALIVHHTDAEREWAYDRNSSVGKLDKALDVGGLDRCRYEERLEDDIPVWE